MVSHNQYTYNSIEERFWDKVSKNGPLPTPEKQCTEVCWIWLGHLQSSGKGYGGFTLNGKILGAHRFSYELAYGVIPIGMNVCHKCDNPVCVNPTHLFFRYSKG